MIRLVFPLLSLLVAVISVVVDRRGAAYDGKLCLTGLCRFDQIAASVDTEGMNTANIQIVIQQNPGDPLLWCTFGELLALEGDDERAAEMYDHATELGPAMAPVLMRTANFDFTHGRMDHALSMTSKVLAATPEFDQILFSYLTAFKLPTDRLLDTAIPRDSRAAQSWLSWLQSNGDAAGLQETWNWMTGHDLADERTAVALTQTFWQRKSYDLAQSVWAGWHRGRVPEYLNPERIWNPGFDREPTASPFDWSIQAPPSVQIVRKEGLQIAFSGQENVSLSTVRQFVTVAPGRYRFAAEVKASGLTTDQRPYFHIVDAVRPGALDVQIPIDTQRYDFTIPPGTATLQIQIERRPSERFDNKLAGSIHLTRLSLVRL